MVKSVLEKSSFRDTYEPARPIQPFWADFFMTFFHLCFLFYRFYGFRRLNYNTKNGKLGVSGFCDPHSKEDVTADDAEMWEATADNAPDGLSVDQAKYVTPFLVFINLFPSHSNFLIC